ncbi:hypothetical protein ACWDUL_39895 [Nocardia niigatensis]
MRRTGASTSKQDRPTSVKIYRNKYLVGWTQGICTASDGSCGGM